MRKVLKWSGIALGGLLVVLLVAGAVLHFLGGKRLARRFDVRPAAILVPADDAAVERGRHLATAITLCHACHGDNLGGQAMFEAPGIAAVYASNLTRGRGGIASAYTDEDYVRAIRHGVNRDGRGLLIMHSDAYNHLGAADLGAIIAYVKSMAPVDNVVPGSGAAPLGRVFVALGLFDSETMPLLPAEVIDHEAALADAPTPSADAAYGRYLVSIAVCAMCHGRDLRGGPPIEEGAPPAPSIADLAAPGGWSIEQFIRTLRSGVTPYGKTLDGEVMPWEVYAGMTDQELTAIWRYIGSLRSESLVRPAG